MGKAEDIAAWKSECTKKIEDNFNGSKKNKPQALDSSALSKVKGNDPIAKRKLKYTTEKVTCLAWSPVKGDQRMVMADQLGMVTVFNPKKGTRTFGFRKTFVQAVALHPTKMIVLAGGMDNQINLYRENDKSDPKIPASRLVAGKAPMVEHDGYISSLEFLDENKFVSASGDADCRLWDMNKGKSYATFHGHEKDAQNAKFARDDAAKNTFVTCSSDKTVKLWDIRMGACAMSFTAPGELNACDIFPNGQAIACGGVMDKVFLFDVRAQSLVAKYARNNQQISAVAFSGSGRTLYVGHDDGSLIIWDLFASGENKAYAAKIEAHLSYYPLNEKKTSDGKPVIDQTSSRVSALTCAPDGAAIASAGFDGLVKIWGAPATGA